LLAASVARAWSDEAAAVAAGRSLGTDVPKVAVAQDG
jgi:hypothetical protein